jgi:hypothetical protein
MSDFDSFLLTRISEATRIGYNEWVRKLVGDPDAFLSLARADRQKAEQLVADAIVAYRSKAGGARIKTLVSATKSFLDYYDVPLSWKRLKSLIPKGKKVAADRAPELSEIRQMWAVATPRERALVSMLISLGGRRGVFWFPSARGGYSHMKLKDLVFDGDGPATVTVYPGEPEEYRTFISPEAVSSLNLTLELRKRVGEILTPDSPVMRDMWEVEYKGDRRGELWHPEEAHPLRAQNASEMLKKLKRKAGIYSTSKDGGFKAAHGFRKYFKSNFPACPLHGDLEAEALMGHREAYDKIPWSHVKERYLAAVPHLTIDERFTLKEEIATKEKEHSEAWRETRLQVLELKDENRGLKDTLDRLVPVVERMKELQKEYRQDQN